MRMNGKVAIVTGGSRGIGEAIARRLVADGASVLIASRKPDQLEAAAQRIGGDVLAVAAHVAEDGAAERCMDAANDRWGHIDVLINNAGINPHAGSIESLTRAQFTKLTDVNLWGPLSWANAAVRAGLGADGGVIVNISSASSLMYGAPVGPYATTKAALNYLTKHLAVELAPHIRVNAIAPGVVATAMATALTDQGTDLCSQWPVPRFGEPEDVAALAAFLAGPDSSWLTGQVIAVDGGASLLSPTIDLAH
jgi:NAD(P)-dependent dehydrogenase (short-subunit alcohol dehydrogenase family)